MGLGNPGPRYAATRHNVGFMVLERLVKGWGLSLRGETCSSRVAEGSFQNQPVRLALPQTFMNSAGEAVGCFIRRWRLKRADLLVILDDVALPLGRIRLRASGSGGGHLGLSSILAAAGTDEIPRLRVGIGPAARGPDGKELTGFVLGRFASGERTRLEEGLTAAVEACEIWVTSGLAKAMNRFNQKAKGA